MTRGRKPGDGRGRLGGRKKGTPNKRVFDARALAETLDVDPLEVLLRMSKRDWAGLGLKERVEVATMHGSVMVDAIPPELQMKAAKEAVRYLYPALKSVEHKGDAANLLVEFMCMDPEERGRRIAELEKRRQKVSSDRKRGRSKKRKT